MHAAPCEFAEMRWRHIGPFSGGRTVAAVGVPSQPNVYVGVNNGGVGSRRSTAARKHEWTPTICVALAQVRHRPTIPPTVQTG